MLSHQEVELFERITRIKRCGLVGETMSLEVGFKVSKAHARFSFSLSVSLPLSPSPSASIQVEIVMHHMVNK